MLEIKNFDLFLFDMDGLLIDSENLHFEAYKQMCLNRGVKLTWDFSTYCLKAHYGSDKLQKYLLEEYPLLKQWKWDELYHEKKTIFIEILEKGVRLMPGVEGLLQFLQKEQKDVCVVTHSPKEAVESVCRQHQILKQIVHWIKREDYSHPKPHPECYLKAVGELKGKKGKVIGFEDSPRGVQALLQANVFPVWVTKVSYPDLDTYLKRGAHHLSSLEKIHY